MGVRTKRYRSRVRSSPLERPNLPTFLAGKYRDRVADRGIHGPLKTLAEQRFEFSGLEPERRAAPGVVEEKESGQTSSGTQKLGDTRCIARPKPPRKRAQKRALVDEIERRFEIKFKKIGEPHPIRQRPENASRALDRGVGEVDREHVEPRFSENAHFVARATAGDEYALAARLRFQELFERRRNSARVPRSELLAEPLLPEFGLRRIFLRHRFSL